MDSLSEGLSNLTPTSPTTSGPAPVFPVLTCDASRSEPARMIHTPLSQSAPSALCHIRTDHAYQVTSLFTASRHLIEHPLTSICTHWSVCVMLWVWGVVMKSSCTLSFCQSVFTLRTSYSSRSPTQGSVLVINVINSNLPPSGSESTKLYYYDYKPKIKRKKLYDIIFCLKNMKPHFSLLSWQLIAV